jgi:glutaredoxin 3
VAYEERDVARDARHARELVRMGSRGVPTLVVKGEVIIGFDRGRIEELLEL